MKKSKKDLSLIVPLALSIVSFIIGCALIVLDDAFHENMCLYFGVHFYILAFTTIIIYFVSRKKGEYEYLFLSLINVICATLLLIFQNMESLILGTSVVVFTTLFLFNRVYKVLYLKNNNNFMWGVKAYGTFLVLLLGALTSFNLYREITYAPLMLGYFFITFSIITSVESLIELFITENKFRQIMLKLFVKREEKLEEIKEEEKEIKKVVKRKATKKTKDA